MKESRTHRRAALLTLFLIAMAAAVPLWGPGMVNTRGGGDSPFLLQRTQQLVENMRAGTLPARWMPDAAYGLGYPFFSYYAALPYYLAGALVLAGLDILSALKLVQTLGLVASSLAMVGWMQRMTSNRWAAWLAAAAYTVVPYHLVNVYVRGDSLSEFYAFVFYPLILWGLDRLSDPGPFRRGLQWSMQAAVVALAYAGLILSHILSALIFSPFVVIYLLALTRRSSPRWRPVLMWGLAGIGLGLVLAAWVWLPILAEKNVIQTGTLTEGYFHYDAHFRTTDLIQPHLLFNYRIDPDATTPFAMGLPQAILAALGGLALLRRGLARRLDARWAFVLLGLLLATAMITPLSRPLWDHAPLLSTIQFPWRFLSVQALFTAAATAALLPRSGPLRSPRSAAISVPLTALLVLSAIGALRPERLPVDPADVTTERLQLYELFAGNIGTTIRYEYLYQAVVPRPHTSGALIDPGAPPRAIPLDGALLQADEVEHGPTHQLWQVRGDGGGIAFPILYWPGWMATVDGQPADVEPVKGSGYLALHVPPGEHTVLLRLGRTPVRVFAETVSLIAAAIVVALGIGYWISAARSSRGAAARGRRYLGITALSVLALLLVARWAPDPAAWEGDADLTMDFAVMPFLHHNPGTVDFGDGVRLAGYTLSTREPSPGESLTVTLDWVELADTGNTATVALVSPAAVRNDVAPLATQTVALDGGPNPTPVTLHLPADTPRGVYLLQLRVDGPTGERFARTLGGDSQGTLYLQPVSVRHGPVLAEDTSVLAPFGPSIRLHAAEVSQDEAEQLAVQLQWSVKYPVAANYGISLRLVDADEQVVAAIDTQPGYGFLPTSLWRPGELVTDRYSLPSIEELPEDDVHLQIILYQVSTFETIGQARIGDFRLPLSEPFTMQPPPRSFVLPPLDRPLDIDFADVIRLAGYDVVKKEEAIRLTLWWQALDVPPADYTVFVHLFDPLAGTVAVQRDAMPQNGAYPTSWWSAGEVISETVTLPLDDVPPGVYELVTGLYDRTTTRLPAVGPDGRRLLDDRLVLPEQIEVAP